MDPRATSPTAPSTTCTARCGGTTGTANTAQGFVGGVGHLSEAATGLIYMRARYYDPNTGRFASEDPKCSGNNWYWYADDNPVNNMDETGQNTISFLQKLADYGWWQAGLFLTYYACMVASAGTVPGYKVATARANAVATAAACLAIFCFGYAMTGIDGSLAFDVTLMANIISISACVYTMMSMKSASGGVAGGIAGIAVTAAITEGCIELGILSSIGTDT